MRKDILAIKLVSRYFGYLSTKSVHARIFGSMTVQELLSKFGDYTTSTPALKSEARLEGESDCKGHQHRQ